MKFSLALVALVVAAFAQPALAQKDDKPGRGGGPDKSMHGKGNDNAPGQGQGQGKDKVRASDAATTRRPGRRAMS